MRIKKVSIENFKRFRDVEIDLEEFNCLVGPNNSGKTTLLQALSLFDFCVHHSISGRNDVLEIKRRSIAPEEFYVLPIANPSDLWTDRKSIVDRKPQVIRISLTFTENRNVLAEISLKYNRIAVSIESEDRSQDWLNSLKDFHVSYLPVFSMFLPQEERRTSAIIADELARGRVGVVIRNLLLDLKEEKHHEQLIEILRRIFPSMMNMKIQFDQANDRYITVNYKEEGRPKEFDLFSAGSGFQQFVYLFGFILLRKPTVILLDEPDVHLHGALQVSLLDELRRLVADGKQVLISTHSRDLINQVKPEEIISLEESGVKRLSVAFDVYDILDKLGSIELAQLPIIQMYKRVLILEDRTDWDILSIFCSKSLGMETWSRVKHRLAVCYSKGNPCRQDIRRLAQQLQQIIFPDGQMLKAFVIADRDYCPDLETLRKSLPAGNIRWHIWERTEIENYLLSISAITRVNEDHPLFGNVIRDEFNKLVDSSRNTANDRLANAFQEHGRRLDKKWDAGAASRKAREFLEEHWEKERLAFADAKEIVLPGIKRYLQDNKLKQFSNKKLAETLKAGELPSEIHELAKELAEFAGIATPGRQGARPGK